MNPPPDEPMELRVYQTSCERCRKRKIKCDRTKPCSKCKKAKIDCSYAGSGEKQRPISRGYVQALEGQIVSLEKFITKLIAADVSKRDEMLANFKVSSKFRTQPPPSDSPFEALGGKPDSIPISIRSRDGHLRKLRDGKAAEFYGATSFFQISPSNAQGQPQDVSDIMEPVGSGNELIPAPFIEPSIDEQLTFAPSGDVCRRLMATFFQSQYQYHMCLYREYFLRDYDAGQGPYYSDLLMYAICAMGALACEEVAIQQLSSLFFNKAQELLYGSALESPNLTTLQALILLGHREIGYGKTSKGWLFSGMAFRLAHEMGLHLDPNNWNGSDDSRIEREILRRTYWAAFIADKQLSLYFGRPPALYPGESDVRDTERIPYPPEWESLLNTYIQDGTSETAYEDGHALVAGWKHKVELCKILHKMITEVFENRGVDEIVLATNVKNIHVSLTKWLADLPAKLHWNQWVVGSVPSLVLHLHMLYHTAMIILHRPPRQSFRDPDVSASQGVAICYESLEANIKLLRTFSRLYNYRSLPFTFVHILASTASVILMKRYINNTPWNDDVITRTLGHVLEALEGISQTWPCAKQVRGVIVSAMQAPNPEETRNQSPESFDFMAGLGDPTDSNPFNIDISTVDGGFEYNGDEFGLFDPATLIDGGLRWTEDIWI